ncbi:hypothetical protein [Salipiger sp. IMCC34102]|uniref:hypothetical protein n=1 Tax=Salipiger sp. IMCC34102 TaxID=2510647 RepID=UPI0013EDDE06|nr:hypothetical protein [Salipiger sp. IMCC34102]
MKSRSVPKVTSHPVLGVQASAPHPTVLGAALLAAAVCLPLLLLWVVLALV